MEPWHQKHWDWKAAGNFICGGAGTGLFAVTALAGLRHGSLPAPGWAALALVALGLFFVLLKIGRPWRSISVLRQPQRSWMAREAWVATGFFPLAALGLWLESATTTIAAAVLALAYLFSQAMMLKEAKGIPAWRTRAIVPLMVATGLAEGAGLLLAAVAPWSLLPLAEATAIAAAVLAALRGWCWRAYVARLGIEGAPKRALAALAAFTPWFFFLGLALPVALIAIGLLAPNAAAALFVPAGLAIFAAGAAAKFILVTRAGYNQGFALTHTPVRGSGTAGPAVKPGWSTS